MNVVAGRAKRGLAKLGLENCMTSLPTVILGSQHQVFRLRNVDCHSAELTSPIGDMLLQVFVSSGERIDQVVTPADASAEPSVASKQGQ